MSARQWQAVATWPTGAVFTFGLRAKDEARATGKAAELAAQIRPGASLAVTRIYWRGMREARDAP